MTHQKIKRKTPLNAAITALAVAELDAMTDFARPGSTDPEALHNLRVAGKRLRALLHLLRWPLGKPRLEAALQQVRAVLAPLAAFRDQSSLRGALDRLRGEALTAGDPLTIGLDAIEKGHDDLPTLMADFREHLHALRPTLDFTDVKVTRADLSRALGATFARNIKAWASAESQPADETFHAWRKAAKRLYYQLHALHAVAPKPLRRLETAVNALGITLGEAHDFAALADALDLNPVLAETPDAADAETRARKRAAKCGRRALDQAPGIYRLTRRELTRAIAGHGKHLNAETF